MKINELEPNQISRLSRYQGNNDALMEETAEKFNHFLTVEFYRKKGYTFYEDYENERDIRGDFDDKEEEDYVQVKNEMEQIFCESKRELVCFDLFKGIGKSDATSHKLSELNVGDTFVIPCYCSTSADENVARCFAKQDGIVLEIKKGYKAAFVEMENKAIEFGKAGDLPEAEFLLEKELTFKIDEIKKKDNYTYYSVSVVI